MLATNASFQAGRSATIGGHQRRFDEWQFQSNTAAKELEQIDKQIVANEIRKQIAEREIANHDQQIDTPGSGRVHARQVHHPTVVLVDGGANFERLLSYLSAGSRLAKRAERAYRFELGLKNSSFIDFGYWDSLKKGLLSGERLTSISSAWRRPTSTRTSASTRSPSTSR